MKQSKKLLCMLLVMLLAFSSVSIGVNAAYTAYDKRPAGYDIHGDAVISSAQRSSMLLDYVDGILAEKDMVFDYDYVIVKVYVDLRSIDRAFDSINSLLSGSTYDLLCKLGAGDLEDIDSTYLKTNRRTTAGITDLDMLYTIIQFANSNSNLIKKYLTGNLNLGKLANMFVSLDSPAIAEKANLAVYNALVDSNAEAVPAGYTADQALQTFVNTMALGGKDKDGDIVEGYLPSMTGKTSLTNYSLYQFIENAANAAMKDIAAPLIEEKVRPLLKEAVEAAKKEFGEEKAKFITDNVNVDFKFDYTWGQYGTSGIVGELNHFIYYVVSQVWKGDAFWVDGANTNIRDNFGRLIKIVYEKFGDMLLPASADFKPVSEVNAMSTEKCIAYIGGEFVKVYAPYVLFKDSTGKDLECNTFEQLACYALASMAAEIVPEQNYLGQIELGQLTVSSDLAIQMATDIGVYYLNAYTTIDVPTGLSFEASLRTIVNWALKIENFGGFFATCGVNSSDTVWQKLDKTVFKLIPLSIFGGGVTGSYDLIMNHFVNAIFDLNFDPILSLFYKTSTNPLNKTALQFVIWFLNNTLGIICAGRTIIPANYTTLASILTDDSIGTLAQNLLAGLVAQGKTLWNSALQFVTPAMGLEDDLTYVSLQPASGYGTKTIANVQTQVDNYGDMLGYAEDEYDLNVNAWNHKTDYELWTYRRFDKAISSAESLVASYNAAVAKREAAKTEDEITAANTLLATFTSEKITKVAYAVDYYYGILTQREACTTQLDYVRTLNQSMGYNKNNYSKEVWDNYQKAVQFANTVTNMDTYKNETPYLKQSMVNVARRNLISAMKLLDSPMADYSKLDAYIAEIDKMDLTKYTEESVSALNLVLDSAKALSRILGIDDQSDVNDILYDLKAAVALLEEIKDPEFKIIDEKVTVEETGLIYGLKENLSKTGLEKLFVTGDNGGKIEIVNPTGGNCIGTGTKIQLVSNNVVLDEVEAIIFGDITGDGVIDGADIIVFDLWWNFYDDSLIEYGSSNYFAFDINGDGSVMDDDEIDIDLYINYAIDIDQQNPYARA